MDIGVCIASDISDIDYAVLAEELGFSHVWVADSHMIWSDCYAVLALVAERTSRVKIGTGVAIAGTRPSAVTAAAHATINRLAPGRVFCGIGTGNTAMRIMGHKPIGIAEFGTYLGELRSLMAGEETRVHWRGKSALTRHLMPDLGFVAFEPRIPMYVSAFGPKAMALAAQHGDGLIASIPPQPEAVRGTWNRLHDAARTVGRELDEAGFLTATLTTMVVLEPGERTDSARVMEEAGAFGAASLHYVYEQWRQYGRRPPEVLADVWSEYVASVDDVPEERRHLRVHQGHNCWVAPEDERFVTPELLEATCLIGTPEQLAARLRALEDAGLHQVTIIPSLAPKEKVIRDVATKVMPLLARA
jgi:alkanesulfonate monooxygenase SsuD/methylene tetrahydromethanopterin reductase-like flavin-dependent oxidoreductase (luciferase family)